MSPFWSGLFENLRGRGRNAALFLVALPTLLISATVLTRIPEEAWRKYLLPALLGFALLGAAWSVRAYAQARARRKSQLARQSLSSDELRKARMKLVRQQTQPATKNSLVPPG